MNELYDEYMELKQKMGSCSKKIESERGIIVRKELTRMFQIFSVHGIPQSEALKEIHNLSSAIYDIATEAYKL